jgi:hypothetical protein
VVVGVTDEAEGLVKKFIESNGVKYPICIVQGGATDDAYGVKGFPHGALVAPDGTIAEIGHPAGFSESKIEELLAKAVFIPPLPAKYGAINAEIAKKNFGKAFQAIEKELAKGDDPELEKAKAAIEKLAGERIADAEAKAKEGEYADGAATLDETAKQWKGMPAAEEASRKLKEWKADKTIAAQIKAGDDLKKADALAKLEDPGAKKKAYGIYSDIAKKLPGTRIGERAKEAAERLKSGG